MILKLVATHNEMPFAYPIVKAYLDGKEIAPLHYISPEIADDIGAVRVGESIEVEGDYEVVERLNETYQYMERILQKLRTRSENLRTKSENPKAAY